MAIKSIQATNFKSFGKLNIKLKAFNVLIGANASGKSNFISLLKFLKTIGTDGLSNAIFEQGGAKYLTNMKIGISEDLSVRIVHDVSSALSQHTQRTKTVRGEPIHMVGKNATYEFSIRFNSKGTGYQITKEKLELLAGFRSPDKNGDTERGADYGNGTIKISRSMNESDPKKQKVIFDIDPPQGVRIKEGSIIPEIFVDDFLSETSLFLEQPYTSFFLPWENIFSEIGIYDFDPNMARKSVQLGKPSLNETAENLAVILRKIEASELQNRKFLNLVRDLLPFIRKFEVNPSADKSLIFMMREKFFPRQSLPSWIMSDGTINIAALTIALFFEGKLVTVIEEPERNLHPYLIAKVVEMMRDASKDTQVIVTTQNSDVVRHAGIESILLVSRGQDGFSTIMPPIEKKHVKDFLENEIGVEELFTQNLLE